MSKSIYEEYGPSFVLFLSGGFLLLWLTSVLGMVNYPNVPVYLWFILAWVNLAVYLDMKRQEKK